MTSVMTKITRVEVLHFDYQFINISLFFSKFTYFRSGVIMESTLVIVELHHLVSSELPSPWTSG